MYKFLERSKLPKLTPEETENFNRHMSTKETEFLVRHFQQRKLQAQMASLISLPNI